LGQGFPYFGLVALLAVVEEIKNIKTVAKAMDLFMFIYFQTCDSSGHL
jgi:hypothetical protein